MKHLIVVILLLTSIILANAQSLHLDQCLQLAENNYPIIDKIELLKKNQELNNKIANIAYFPSVKLNATATLQSDITQIEIDNQWFTTFFQDAFPTLSKDQYKIFAEFSQAIWDGGVNSAQKEIEKATIEAGISQVELELYNHKERVINIFFAGLGLQKQIEILELKKWQLDEIISEMRALVDNQVITKTQLDELLAEKLILNQNITELHFEEQYYLNMLGVYCGSKFDSKTALLVPTPQLNTSKDISRPELNLFQLQSAQIQANKHLLKSSKMPHIYAFGQAGYGRPGLDMFKNDFAPYAVVGIKAVWTPWEWNMAKFQNEILDVKSGIVKNTQDIFLINQNAAIQAQFMKIEKLKEISKTDAEILELRESITKNYLAQLNGQVIRSSEYLTVLNEENSQRLKNELHQLMLYEAIVKYNLLKGELYKM